MGADPHMGVYPPYGGRPPRWRVYHPYGVDPHMGVYHNNNNNNNNNNKRFAEGSGNSLEDPATPWRMGI